MNRNMALMSLKQGGLICNKSGRMVYFNEEYARYLGHDVWTSRIKQTLGRLLAE